MKTPYQNDIVNKIRQIRLSRNVSQNQVAEILGVSPGHVGNIETPSCSHKYTLKQLSVLCDEFDVNIESLFINGIENIHQDEIIKRLINCIIEYEK
ncbi:MAG: helix-turn-helix transcriptional regulator [Paludibacteraceae bacterium]|nr:helix-turn-helix transcriptional regulator [Paludibacteraceae bacterium]